MNNEQAIDRLRKISEKTPIRTNGDDLVAITMAIQALSQEPCIYDLNKVKQEVKQEPCRYWQNGKCNGNTEVCDDAVSRQAVLALVADYDLSMGQVVKCIHALPSVTQKSAKDYLDMAERKAKKIKDALTVTQKSGKWIDREEYDADRWKCSICGRTEQYQERYCPSCGAKMESEE